VHLLLCFIGFIWLKSALVNIPALFIYFIIIKLCTINIINIYITTMHDLHYYMFRHFHVIIREFTRALR